jgi:hypothetical protein
MTTGTNFPRAERDFMPDGSRTSSACCGTSFLKTCHVCWEEGTMTLNLSWKRYQGWKKLIAQRCVAQICSATRERGNLASPLRHVVLIAHSSRATNANNAASWKKRSASDLSGRDNNVRDGGTRASNKLDGRGTNTSRARSKRPGCNKDTVGTRMARNRNRDRDTLLEARSQCRQILLLPSAMQTQTQRQRSPMQLEEVFS